MRLSENVQLVLKFFGVMLIIAYFLDMKERYDDRLDWFESGLNGFDRDLHSQDSEIRSLWARAVMKECDPEPFEDIKPPPIIKMDGDK